MMQSKIAALARVSVVAAAAALVVAVPADAGVHGVSGTKTGEQIVGGLVGTITDTPDSFATFLATRKLTPGGVLTFRMPVVFEGTINGRTGTLRMDVLAVHRFRPGTRHYDFESPEAYQPGTTGDPAAWLGGSSLLRIRSGTGDLAGASGLLYFRDTVFLSEQEYWGIVLL
jgi:hypothetical protein